MILKPNFKIIKNKLDYIMITEIKDNKKLIDHTEKENKIHI